MQADRLSPLIGSRYRLESQLGRGGMGEVYRALDDLTGEEVALKRVLTPTQHLQFASRISDNSTASESTNLRLALAQEFHTLASLRHPNIIRVLDYGFDADRQPYLTMDLLHEPRNLLEAGRGQSLGFKINLLIQTLQALAYLHRREVIHRDLKPDNIAVVHENGAPHVRVLDFGLALTMPDSLHTGAHGLAGTLAYMAPEVLQGGQASVASDLYALGVIAFELLAGKHPFHGDSTRELVNNILRTDPDLAPLLDLQPQRKTDELILIFDSSGQSKFRATLVEIIDKLLAKHPADRYNDAYAVITDLCAAADLPLPEESDAIRESFLQAARFVGRDAEIHQLRRALTDASVGKGSLWLVGGESGVGKSRLLDELRKWAMIEGVLTLRGQAVNSGGQPFQLWHDPLRRLILSTGLHHEEASVLSTILPEVSIIFDDVPLPPAGRDLQGRLTEIIIDLFQRHHEPMVLLLEDLQWGAEGLQALKGLASFISDLPLLIVGSFRDDERPRLPEELPQAQLITLTRFGQDEIALLTRSMLGEARPDVLDYLQRETEGNAFFLVETVRALAEEAGRLSEIGHEALPEHLLVGGVQEVIWRRLNRVPPSAHGLLKLAAVIGRELDLRLLRQALQTGVYGPARLHGLELEDWLTTCANRAVFESDGSGWRFAHDKLREALLDALTPEERAAYHREAAEAIEAVYPAELERYASALANHWREAGDWQKEGPYLLIAMRHASESSAYPEARDLCRRALEICAYEDQPNPTEALAEIHNLLGYAYFYLSEYNASREHQRESLALYQSLGHRKGIADTISGLGEVDLRQGLHDQAQAAFEKALPVRLELGINRDIGYAYMNLGVVEANENRWEKARAYFKLSLDYMQRGSSPRDLTRALNNYANVIDVLGDHEGARQYHLQALDIRKKIHDVPGMTYSYSNLGSLELDLKNLDAALNYTEQALAMSQRSGDRHAIAAQLSMLGEIRFLRGEYEQARGYFQRSLDLRTLIEDRRGIAQDMERLANIARETGDYDGALVEYQQALAFSIETHLEVSSQNVIAEIARMLMEQHKLRSALKLLTYVRAHRATPVPGDDETIGQLEMQMPANAFAAAQALGEALTFEEISTRVAQGDLDF